MSRILVVDDDKNVRFAIEHVLLAAGYMVESADTAFNARALLCAQCYDLVVADVKLGGDDGDGFEIADISAKNGAKTLIVTGYATTLQENDLARHQYLVKPVKPRELIRAVEALIGESQIQNSNSPTTN
jgi:DNA-binding response OmpR family regulator